MIIPSRFQANNKRLKQKRQRARKNRRLRDQISGSGVVNSVQSTTWSLPASAGQPGTSYAPVPTNSYVDTVEPSFLGSGEWHPSVGPPHLPVDFYWSGDGGQLAEDVGSPVTMSVRGKSPLLNSIFCRAASL